MNVRRSRVSAAILYPLSSILCLLLASCATVDTGNAKLEAKKQTTAIIAIDFYGSDLKFAWTFTNPYDREIKLISYVWEFQVEGKRIQHGQSRQLRRIPPHESFTLELPVSVKHANLEKLLNLNSLPAQLPYQFIGKANLGASVSSWAFDLKDEGQINLLASPQFGIQKFRIKSMDKERANVAMEILIRNPNTFATTLKNFKADLVLAGQTIAQELQGPTGEIAPSGTAVVPIDLDLNFTHVGQVVYRALNQAESSYTLYGQTEVSTPWGVKKMNYDQSGKITIER